MLDADRAAAGAQARVTGPDGGAFRGGASWFSRLPGRRAAGERLAADRAALDEAVVAAEGWHSLQSRSAGSALDYHARPALGLLRRYEVILDAVTEGIGEALDG